MDCGSTAEREGRFNREVVGLLQDAARQMSGLDTDTVMQCVTLEVLNLKHGLQLSCATAACAVLHAILANSSREALTQYATTFCKQQLAAGSTPAAAMVSTVQAVRQLSY